MHRGTEVRGHAAISPEQLAEIREKDQRRIAFDLHDGPAQAISRALLQIGICENMSSSQKVSLELAELRGLVKSALAEINMMMRQLRPHSLESDGLVGKMDGLINEIETHHQCGDKISFSVTGREPTLSASAQISVFRIAQEAINNSLRHSGANHVTVALEFEDEVVRCQVRDDGRGFTAEAPKSSGARPERFGLIGMRERAELLGGEVQVTSLPGEGTVVTAEIPIWREP